MTGDVSIARALARSAGPASSSALLGTGSPTAEAEVDEWVEAVASLSPPALLSALDAACVDRTYLAGSGISLADVVVAVALGKPGAAQPAPHSAAARWLGTARALLDLPVPAVGGVPAAASASATTPTAAAGATPAAAPAAGGRPAKGKPTKAEGAPADAAKGKGDGTPRPPKAAPMEGAPSKNIGGGGAAGAMPALVGGVMGEVVTRFPPEPSGYLHIGHIKAVLLNDFYARAYKGKLLIRFDDTNPSKEKEEFEANISADLAAVGIVADSTSHTSDYFDMIADHARGLINRGLAFMDDTPREAMQAERLALKNSVHRDDPVALNAERFEAMLKGGPDGSKWCLRVRMDMQVSSG